MTKVSIILPSYNRAAFLPQAFESIRAQSFTDWELLVVDDGSTDETAAIVEDFARDTAQQVHYISQANAGAYGARNTGLDHVTGELVAFFDSDDYWLPHHLADCVAALEANSDVDWVYGAGRIVDYATDKVLAENTFYIDGRPRPFLSVASRDSGNLKILGGPEAMRAQIDHGLYCGLQKSALRREVFDQRRFEAQRRNEAEDQLFVIHFLAEGRQLGYLDNVHVIYRIHEANSSAARQGKAIDRQIVIIRKMIEGYEELPSLVPMDSQTLRALSRRAGREYFWTLGYSLYWQNGRRREAIRTYQHGLKHWPWELACWKTYLLARVRCLFSAGHHTSPDSVRSVNA